MGPMDVDSDFDDGWELIEAPGSGAAGREAAADMEERWVLPSTDGGRAKYVSVNGEAAADAKDDRDDVGSENSVLSARRGKVTRPARKPCVAKKDKKNRQARKKKLAPFGRSLYP